MSSLESVTESHIIEAKGPSSYWVHRYRTDSEGIGQRFSRPVFFARDRKDAERYIRKAETPPC